MDDLELKKQQHKMHKIQVGLQFVGVILSMILVYSLVIDKNKKVNNLPDDDVGDLTGDVA
jgi:hypothetical protein